MRKALTALMAVSAVAFTAVYLPSATPVSAVTCDDIKIVYARGSGQTLGMKEFKTLKSNIELELVGLEETTYDFYELGTDSYAGHKYPAIGLDFFKVISAKISAGSAFDYGKSVAEGSAELTAYIEVISKTCPNTKFVLAGYSQGAQVISISTPKINPEKVLYAATFGDPKLYLPEGKGITPPACAGKNLSTYRAYVPNCKTYQGSLGAKKPYEESGWTGKLGLYCNDKDLICGSGINLSASGDGNPLENIRQNAMSSHSSYPDYGTIRLAAEAIAKKIVTATLANKDSVQNDSSSNNPDESALPSNNQNKNSVQNTNLILVDYAAIKDNYPNKKQALSLVQQIYQASDSIYLGFYHHSQFNDKNRLYYHSKLREQHNFIIGSIDTTWSSVFLGTIDKNDSAKSHLDYLLNSNDPTYQNIQKVYLISDDPSIEEISTSNREIIHLDLSSNKPTSLLAKTKMPSNFTFATSAPAAIDNLTYILYMDEITLKYELNGLAVFVSINDAPLGLVKGNTLEISDINVGDKIRIRPISQDGNFGEEKIITVGSQPIPTIENSSHATGPNQRIILTPNSGKH